MIPATALRWVCRLNIALAFIFFSSSSPASDPNWLLRSWQANDGLPDNTIVGAAQTPDGFLWVATQVELVRFNGLSFQEYPSATSIGGLPRMIETILLDRSGRLWMAESGGSLVCIEAGRIQSLFTTANGLLNLQAMELAEDGQGAIWISYAGGRIIRFKDGRGFEFTDRDGMPPGIGCRLVSDRAGRLWIAAKTGEVGLFRGGTFTTLVHLPANAIRLASSHDGGIWICTNRKLFKYFEGGMPIEIGALPSPAFNISPTMVYEDHAGAVWIGTEETGLFRYANSHFTKVETSYHEIWSVTEDREGDIWVGTRGAGLDWLRPSSVDLVDVGTRVPYDAVQSLCQTTNGDLWSVTRTGALCRNHGDGFQVMSGGINASCVSAGPDGSLWVGTKESGLLSWRPDRGTNLTPVAGLGSRFVRSLLTTPAGDVWIGTERPNTLQRLHGGSLEVFPLPTNSEAVCTMALDATGNFWAGTSDGLLVRVSHDKMVNETSKTFSVPQPIQCLAATADGSVWIGYAEKGLGRLKNNHFVHIAVDEGLFEGDIAQIIPDGHDRIYLAGNRGIFYLREKEFDDVAENREAGVFSVVLSENTPLLQTSRGYWPGALRTADDKLLIPKVNGLAVVDLAKLQSNSFAPQVVLERVIVDGRTVAEYDPTFAAGQSGPLGLGRSNLVLSLSPNIHQMRFEYASLNFADPQNLRFKYKLEGLDENWVDAQERREAYYTRLLPGNYLFQISARDADGAWSQVGGALASLNVVIPPPYWQTWWFRTLASLIILVTIAQLVRYIEKRKMKVQLEKIEREHALERERARIAKDIHDDLGAHLTEISLLSEIVQSSASSPLEMRADIRQIGTIARMLTVSLSEIVWAVNPRNDTFESFVTYSCNYAEEFLRRMGVRCRFEMPAQLPHSVITSELRHNLFLVIKEALNNVSKHAHASEVYLSISLETGGFKLVIKDNGKGIVPPASSSAAWTGQHSRERSCHGNGLLNMRERIDQIGGRLHVSSSPEGTQVEVIMPGNRGMQN